MYDVKVKFTNLFCIFWHIAPSSLALRLHCTCSVLPSPFIDDSVSAKMVFNVQCLTLPKCRKLEGTLWRVVYREWGHREAQAMPDSLTYRSPWVFLISARNIVAIKTVIGRHIKDVQTVENLARKQPPQHPQRRMQTDTYRLYGTTTTQQAGGQWKSNNNNS